MVSLVINKLSLWRRTNYTAECCGNLPQGRQDIRHGQTRMNRMRSGPNLKPTEDAPASKRSTRWSGPRLRTEPMAGRRRSRHVRGDAHASTQDQSPRLGCKSGVTFFLPNLTLMGGNSKYPPPTIGLNREPPAKPVQSAVNRSTPARVSPRSEVCASVSASHGSKITGSEMRGGCPSQGTSSSLRTHTVPSSASGSLCWTTATHRAAG